MLLQQKIDRQGIRTGIWKIEEPESALLDFFRDKEDLLRQISFVNNPAKRCEKLAVRALLKAMVGEEKTIAYLPSGKPELADKSFNISISHTQGYAAIALHENKSIGIDIEFISDRACKINHRFMNIKEREALDKNHEPVVSLLCWSAKETVYKLLGQEGVDFAKDILIHPFSLNDKQLKAAEYYTGKKRKFILDFEVTDQYVMTVGIEK